MAHFILTVIFQLGCSSGAEDSHQGIWRAQAEGSHSHRGRWTQDQR
jgi:hypothetical protein